jgi:hypothetical protein
MLTYIPSSIAALFYLFKSGPICIVPKGGVLWPLPAIIHNLAKCSFHSLLIFLFAFLYLYYLCHLILHLSTKCWVVLYKDILFFHLADECLEGRGLNDDNYHSLWIL